MSGIIITLFLICSLLALLDKEKGRESSAIILVIALICLAGFRLPSRDYGAYMLAYEAGGIERFEPSFTVISKIAKSIHDSPYTLFVIYAILGVSIKILSMRKLSSFFYLSIIVYLSNFFILNELIQIRAGVAAGILLFATKYIYERNFPYFIILCGIATLFHYSSVVFIPLYLVSIQTIDRTLWCALLYSCCCHRNKCELRW
jgi:hypothetical protein